MQDSIFIIFGVLVLLIFLGSLSIVRMRTLRDTINVLWYNLADKLQYRQDYLPNLIETIRKFTPTDKLEKHKELIENLVDARSHAETITKSGPPKVEVEHDVTEYLNNLMDLGKKYKEVGTSTNFLELKKQLKDITKEIQDLTSEYNEKVRKHNSVIRKPYNFLPALLMRYKKKYIFTL